LVAVALLEHVEDGFDDQSEEVRLVVEPGVMYLQSIFRVMRLVVAQCALRIVWVEHSTRTVVLSDRNR
jgi:hypothetical protein